MKSNRRALVGVAVAALLAAVIVTVASAAHRLTSSTARQQAAATVWTDSGINVVGGPVVAGGKILVLSRDADKTTWLKAIDPATGRVLWRFRWGFSEITAGVITPPLAHGDIALLLAPGPKNDGLVRLEGIQISTGRVVWRGAQTTYVSDAPTACPEPLGTAGFCIVFELPTGESGLVALDPRTGRELGGLPSILRGMSNTAGVYQAATKTPTLVDIRVPGGVRWVKSVRSLYGPNHSPDYGWDLDRYGTLDIGTISHNNTSKPVQLGGDTTIGITGSSGRRVWSIPGLFQCGGATGLRVAFTCRLTGTVVFSKTQGKLVPSKDATVTIEGFNTKTGKIMWRYRVGDIANLLQGNVAIATPDQIVVSAPRGGHQLLNLTTGRTTPATARNYWCAYSNNFTITPPAGIDPLRVGSSRFTPCDANKRSTSTPGSPAGIAGVSIGNTFIYATARGLTAITG